MIFPFVWNGREHSQATARRQRFQGLEKNVRNFPIPGKNVEIFSNPWKTAARICIGARPMALSRA
jgi:hypothetical protein